MANYYVISLKKYINNYFNDYNDNTQKNLLY